MSSRFVTEVRILTNTQARKEMATLLAAGLLECPHMEHEVPHWQGSDCLSF